MRFMIIARGTKSGSLYHTQAEDIPEFAKTWNQYKDNGFEIEKAFMIQELSHGDVECLVSFKS